MFDKQFCYIAGTGRTATHWFEALIKQHGDRNEVVTWHDGFEKRAKVKGRRTATDFFTNYLLNLMCENQGAQVYVECNPALLEHVALTYGIEKAYAVIPVGLLAQPAKSILVTRSPYDYVASLKAHGYQWKWWNYPQAARVFDLGGFAGASPLQRAARGWALKNQFCLSLLQGDDCKHIKMSSLFNSRVSKANYLERVEGVFDHLGIKLLLGGDHLWRFRDNRIAAKNKNRAKLNAAERATVKRICGDVMECLGYGG